MCAVQLAYSLVQRAPVEDADMVAALAAAEVGVVASYAMAGGVLTGKYSHSGAAGGWPPNLQDQRLTPAVAAGERLRALAESWGESPGALALASHC